MIWCAYGTCIIVTYPSREIVSWGKSSELIIFLRTLIGWRHQENKWFTSFSSFCQKEYVPWIKIYPLQHFGQLISYFCEWKELECVEWWKDISSLSENQTFEVDFEHIKWQLVAKRALSIAMAWFHNVLMVWAPWSWKTMMSKAMKSIFPPFGKKISLYHKNFSSTYIWWNFGSESDLFSCMKIKQRITTHYAETFSSGTSYSI